MNSAICKSANTSVELVFVDRPKREFSTIFSRAAAGLHTWSQRSRQRRQLSKLDQRLLKDIGVAYEDVWAEINKPFWKN